MGRAVDTYWSPDGCQDAHVLRPGELETAVLLFNIQDYERVEGRETWEQYNHADRERITSVHGMREALFVRHGARPCIETQVARAREDFESAGAAVRAAAGRLAVARERLAGLDEELVAARERLAGLLKERG